MHKKYSLVHCTRDWPAVEKIFETRPNATEPEIKKTTCFTRKNQLLLEWSSKEKKNTRIWLFQELLIALGSNLV